MIHTGVTSTGCRRAARRIRSFTTAGRSRKTPGWRDPTPKPLVSTRPSLVLAADLRVAPPSRSDGYAPSSLLDLRRDYGAIIRSIQVVSVLGEASGGARGRRGFRNRRCLGEEVIPHHVAPGDEREAERGEEGQSRPEQEL